MTSLTIGSDIYADVGGSAGELIRATRSAVANSLGFGLDVIMRVSQLRGDKEMIINPHSELTTLTGLEMLHDKIFTGDVIGKSDQEFTGIFNGVVNGSVYGSLTIGTDLSDVPLLTGSTFFVNPEHEGRLDNVKIGSIVPAEIVASSLKVVEGVEQVLVATKTDVTTLTAALELAQNSLKPKATAHAATVANVALISSEGALTIDEATLKTALGLEPSELLDDKLVLLTAQTSDSGNGLYKVSVVDGVATLTLDQLSNDANEIMEGTTFYATHGDNKGIYVVTSVAFTDGVLSSLTVVLYSTSDGNNASITTIKTTLNEVIVAVNTLATNLGIQGAGYTVSSVLATEIVPVV